MSRLTDLVHRQESTPNKSRGRYAWRGLVLHIAEGTYEGTIAWQHNPDANVSSEFVIGRDRGEWAQMMDMDAYHAWAQIDGNGYWVATENAGYVADGLSDWQVEANAQILAWLHVHRGVPLQVTGTPAVEGLGHHSMGAENGYNWGHPGCPGAKVKARKGEIVARAVEIVGGDMPTAQEIARAVVAEVVESPALGVKWPLGDWVKQGLIAARAANAGRGEVAALRAELARHDGRDPVDEQQIVQGVLAGLGNRPPAEVAQALVAAGQDPAALATALTALAQG